MKTVVCSREKGKGRERLSADGPTLGQRGAAVAPLPLLFEKTNKKITCGHFLKLNLKLSLSINLTMVSKIINLTMVSKIKLELKLNSTFS